MNVGAFAPSGFSQTRGSKAWGKTLGEVKRKTIQLGFLRPS
jgi:hypothetical protein